MRECSQQPAVSIIIPVYNTEDYLQKCVNSILSQSFVNFELFLVDDGSTDKSGAICDEYAKKDFRVYVHHQNNSGASAARNYALDRASGEYIAFIDSDDYICPDYLSKLYDIAINEQAEVVMCRQFCFKDGDSIVNSEDIDNIAYKTMSGREAIIMRYKGNFSIAPGAKLISRKLFKTVRFPVGKSFEDQAVIPYVIYISKKFCITEKRMYYYRIREQSLSHCEFSEKVFDNILHMNNFILFLENKHDRKVVAKAKKFRDYGLAMYTIMAKSQNIRAIPKEYHMGELKAFCILQKNCSDDKFCWYLSLLHPILARYYEYIIKIKKILFRK